MPRWLRAVIWVVVIAAVVVLLFTVVFPRVERVLEDPTMGAGPSAGSVAASAQDERAAR